MTDPMIIRDVSTGWVAIAEGDPGAIITYIDKNLEIRAITLGNPKPKRFPPPGFVLTGVTEEYLIECLKREAPNAEEIRVVRYGNEHFMWAVTP